MTAYNQPYNSPLQICIAGCMHFSTKNSATCSFQIGTKNPTKKKFIVEPSFFTSWTITGEKMHRGPCKKTKVYMYLYISLYENLFENRQIPTDYSENVQRPISANLGLNFYTGLFFVSSKVFSLAIFSFL